MAGAQRQVVWWKRSLGASLIAVGVGVLAFASFYFWYAQRATASLEGLRVVEEPRALVPVRSADQDGYTPQYDLPQVEGRAVGENLRWADWDTLPETVGAAPRATRIDIPALTLESPVVDVRLIEEDGLPAWQRPVRSVGHHAGTSNPGEAGNVVMSGHINSPVRGEGAVFKRLPEVADLLRAGQTVEVTVYTVTQTFVYQVVASDVVDPGVLNILLPTDRPTLTLITCVPDLVYSHRLVVTALLVKQGEGGMAGVAQVEQGETVIPAS